MFFLTGGRVNIIITNRILRYAYNKNTSIQSLTEHGEIKLPADTIRDGMIVNKPVFLEMINKLVDKHKWKRKKLYFCVPDDTVVIRNLKIPVTLSKEEALRYLKTQIGNSLYLPFENPALAIEFLNVEKDEQHILLFAYPQDKIMAFEKVFEEAGLKPVAADLTALSVFRYYYLQEANRKEHVLLIHWNNDALILTAFKHDKAVFTRYMKTPDHDKGIREGQQIDSAPAQQLISEYLIEIKRIIDFYKFTLTQGESRINLLLLSGDFPYLESVKSALSEEVDIPIHNFKTDNWPADLPYKYIDALGLSMKQEI